MKRISLMGSDDMALPISKVSQSNAAEVLFGDIGRAHHLVAPPVDLRFDRTHLLVGDDEEVARATGGVEDADAAHAQAEVQ